LLARYDLGQIDAGVFAGRRPGPFRYRELLPLSRPPITLGEPETPLLTLPRLSAEWGTEVVVKDDAPLPGGTFKARGAMVGLSRARELGAERLVMPSTSSSSPPASVTSERLAAGAVRAIVTVIGIPARAA
jgi:threonine synthase